MQKTAPTPTLPRSKPRGREKRPPPRRPRGLFLPPVRVPSSGHTGGNAILMAQGGPLGLCATIGYNPHAVTFTSWRVYSDEELAEYGA